MIAVDIEGFGLVREQGQAPYPTFFVSVSQQNAHTHTPTPTHTWTVYRRPAAFRTLSDRLRVGVCVCVCVCVCTSHVEKCRQAAEGIERREKSAFIFAMLVDS